MRSSGYCIIPASGECVETETLHRRPVLKLANLKCKHSDCLKRFQKNITESCNMLEIDTFTTLTASFTGSQNSPVKYTMNEEDIDSVCTTALTCYNFRNQSAVINIVKVNFALHRLQPDQQNINMPSFMLLFYRLTFCRTVSTQRDGNQARQVVICLK